MVVVMVVVVVVVVVVDRCVSVYVCVDPREGPGDLECVLQFLDRLELLKVALRVYITLITRMLCYVCT